MSLPAHDGPADTVATRSGRVLEVEELRRSYGSGERTVTALRGVTLHVDAGELIVVRGRSGSGKTTLLNCIGGLDRTDSGRVLVAGVDVTTASERRLLALRRTVLGFVFQSFGLVPILTARENVSVPLRLLGVDRRAREQRVDAALALVGLLDHAEQRPGELSGGQQQRVSVARAVVHRPQLLIADEPTGQLDSQTGRSIMELLVALVREQQMAAIVATHDAALVALADHVIELRDGAVV